MIKYQIQIRALDEAYNFMYQRINIVRVKLIQKRYKRSGILIPTYKT